MSFAENIKQIRKERQISQEDLAEMLDVSRQAISKWEQGSGYPEVEKLLILSNKLDISLDSLMSTTIVQEDNCRRDDIAGIITITSPHENAIVTCSSVLSSAKMHGGKLSPKYALFGVRDYEVSFWGASTIFLGWYAEKEQIAKEISEIQSAMENGATMYTLKYSAKTERKWTKIKIVEE